MHYCWTHFIFQSSHQIWFGFSSFQWQCITLVNYYSSIFFLEISSIQPEEFCRKVNLCEKVVFLASEFHEDSCGMCHRAVSEVLIKLKDPDTQVYQFCSKLLAYVSNYLSDLFKLCLQSFMSKTVMAFTFCILVICICNYSPSKHMLRVTPLSYFAFYFP